MENANLPPALAVLLGSVLKGLPVTFSMKENKERYTVTLVWQKTQEAREDQDIPNPTGQGRDSPTNLVVVKKKKHKSPSTLRRNRTPWNKRKAKLTAEPPNPVPTVPPPNLE